MANGPKKYIAPTTIEATAFQIPTIEKTLAASESTFESANASASALFDRAKAPANEIQENLRKAAEKGIEGTRAAYVRMKTVAEDATHSLESSYSATIRGAAEFNAKTLDAMRANADAGFSFFKSLAAVKSLPEAMEMQKDHARKQIEALSFQGKEFASLMQKIAADSVAPLKALTEKTMAPSN